MNFVNGGESVVLKFNRKVSGSFSQYIASQMAAMRRGSKIEIYSPSQAVTARCVSHGIEAVRGWKFTTFSSQGKWFVIRVK